MRVLLVDPEDSPRRGPWARQRWDLLVDLGRSSAFSAAEWSRQYACPVLPSEFCRQGISHAKQVREILFSVSGNLQDAEGLDWWELVSLLLAEDVFTLLALKSITTELATATDIWATRKGKAVRMLEQLLHRSVSTFETGSLRRVAARTRHYAQLVRRLSTAQIKEILLDKYDSGHRWRSHLISGRRKSVQPVVMLPTAYSNASRMAAAYARLLPEQPFLMITTRQSARNFKSVPNVQVRDLAEYVNRKSDDRELASLIERWTKCKRQLRENADFAILLETGCMNMVSRHLRDGLHARNAWCNVLDGEPVQAVMCGDDSNLYTRLPVMLAARRKIPTLDFHHGALDGRYVLKNLCCDVYLAKNEMERDYLVRICGLPSDRIVIAAPAESDSGTKFVDTAGQNQNSVIFFSEPYEVAQMRADEVYREVLPALCRLARESGRRVIIKLHPFESRAERSGLARDLLQEEDRNIVSVIDGPLTDALLATAWFGITVLSTAAVDCLQRGVCCFLCGWLPLNPYEYGKQYARFEVGEMLQSVDAIHEIPGRVEHFRSRMQQRPRFQVPADPSILRQLLQTSHEAARVRSSL